MTNQKSRLLIGREPSEFKKHQFLPKCQNYSSCDQVIGQGRSVVAARFTIHSCACAELKFSVLYQCDLKHEYNYNPCKYNEF